ncbi:hypothetical protein C1646_776084 [Rhizophagus diaphanus]|nr:hypothetical protein C1646_776084 [Rhizophagus diaphanus] [Rhizophagus sp. MUCL 43196]
MEEFSDTPIKDILQSNLPENESTDIPIFNVPEIIPPKIILTLPERQADRKNAPPSKDKKADKQDESTQLLFNYVAEDIHALVTSTSGTSETSKTIELMIDELETNKLPESIEPICEVVNTPPKETSVKCDLPKPNEVSSAILLSRVQREEHLRKWAIDHDEDPDIFMTITEKDVDLSREYQDRMMADADVIDFAKENKMNPNDLFYMTRRERLISEEIYL